jgi:hypothetical protein
MALRIQADGRPGRGNRHSFRTAPITGQSARWSPSGLICIRRLGCRGLGHGPSCVGRSRAEYSRASQEKYCERQTKTFFVCHVPLCTRNRNDLHLIPDGKNGVFPILLPGTFVTPSHRLAPGLRIRNASPRLYSGRGYLNTRLCSGNGTVSQKVMIPGNRRTVSQRRMIAAWEVKAGFSY